MISTLASLSLSLSPYHCSLCSHHSIFSTFLDPSEHLLVNCFTFAQTLNHCHGPWSHPSLYPSRNNFFLYFCCSVAKRVFQCHDL